MSTPAISVAPRGNLLISHSFDGPVWGLIEINGERIEHSKEFNLYFVISFFILNFIRRINDGTCVA